MNAMKPFDLPRGFEVRWLAGNRADTAFGDSQAVGAKKAVCAPTPRPPHSKTASVGRGESISGGLLERVDAPGLKIAVSIAS